MQEKAEETPQSIQHDARAMHARSTSGGGAARFRLESTIPEYIFAAIY
ncbi:MAG: hypothetical protein H0W76_12295 [Pyrinomonadaceae bacterium]|nr:hypothetical protein [Pyrinomonadaceae bacterium]